ncbi:MAG TPA: acetolactate synthase small subunit, partial [Eubacteriaceae bacterium]|nr:acetolactate synthase small subunit [Eubacteriaceae bacterium]
KLIEVIKVVELTPQESISRELVFIKVKADNQTRSNIIEIGNIFRANIVDVAKESLILELTGDADKVQAFVDMMEPYGILEFIRSGASGLQRGNRVLNDL